MLKPELQFYVQIALFLALWLILKRWWFDPALRIIKERASRSDGAIAEARAVQAEAERLRSEHESALAQVRQEARREMQEMVRAAEAEQARIVAEANAEAERTLAAARARIAEEAAAARRDLHAQVRDIAREIASKVLERTV
jgi:F-type H+-transporting ATPase subunit b